MQQIDCPWCGKRNEEEFTCGGELISRPQVPESASDQEWTDYLYFRNNLKGIHTEVWRHTAGCRMWFMLERDTVNHAISAVHKLQPCEISGVGGEANE